MQYFTDGLDGLIRVDTDAPRGSREFIFAEAEKLGADGHWYRGRGYYRPATNEEVQRIVAALTGNLIVVPAWGGTLLIFARPRASFLRSSESTGGAGQPADDQTIPVRVPVSV